MKKSIIITSFFLTLSFLSFSQAKNFIDQPYIEINSSTDSLVTPNQIYIKINISEKDSKDKVSIEELENKMVASFNLLGINTETDLTTSDILSNYKYYLLKQKDIIKSKEYILKATDAATASKVFVQLENLGISNTSIDRVDHTDLERIKNVCLTKAIEKAKLKATALTKAIGQTIGNAIFISDSESSIDNELQGRLAGVSIRGARSYSKYKEEAPRIEFEKIKVQANISVKFALIQSHFVPQ